MGPDPVGFESSLQQLAALADLTGAPLARRQASATFDVVPDVDSVTLALRGLVARHEILRTTFA